MALPRNVVREDHRLEKEAEKTSSALAELRWHWTLDESNAKRVSFGDYAADVARAKSSIARSAKSYAVLRTKPGLSIADARTHANLSEDRLAAVEAVANARGVTLETAEHKRRSETRRVQQIAAEKAEQAGTTVEEEAPKVAAWIVKSEQATENVQVSRRQKTDLRLIEAEAKGHRMLRVGLELLELLRTIEWDEEGIELLSDTISQVKALVGLMDVALVGAADVDWDKELAKLNEGGNIMNSLDNQAAELFDLLVENPKGITWQDARDKFGWKHRSHFFRVVRKLRLILGDDDETTVICDPRGMRQTWLYQLVGDPALAYPWQMNRVGDMEARLETVLAVSTSVARTVDARTMAGRKARKIQSTISYLLTELGDLAGD